ncbi:hypothetical protein DFH11DRAFT_1646737, partial [Phellopilus nigrolimitatus]
MVKNGGVLDVERSSTSARTMSEWEVPDNLFSAHICRDTAGQVHGLQIPPSAIASVITSVKIGPPVSVPADARPPHLRRAPPIPACSAAPAVSSTHRACTRPNVSRAHSVVLSAGHDRCKYRRRADRSYLARAARPVRLRHAYDHASNDRHARAEPPRRLLQHRELGCRRRQL